MAPDRSEQFVELLRIYFNEKQRTEKWSMRAFAFYLRIDAATLQKILAGKRRCGPKTIRKIGRKIELAEDVISELVEEN